MPRYSQWFRNGDHPDDYLTDQVDLVRGELVIIKSDFKKRNGWEGAVVRYFRHPSLPGTRVCTKCRKTLHRHGWIDSAGEGQQVCPGDIIETVSPGQYQIASSPDVRP